MANNASLSASINLVGLDFSELKSNFQSYLKGQDQFKDYDFDGSNINVLLELLSYNSFLNAFYLNMAVSEGFLDSAQTTDCLKSHAKELNYLPRSIRSAKASITVNFEATGESQPYVVPKGSQFSTMIKSRSYTFSTPETLVVASANSSYSFTTDIYEGVYQKDPYIFKADTKYRITNKRVDTRSVAVTVFEDGSQVGDIYNLTTSLLDLNETSKVFFLQTSETGYYEIFFGDNNLGRQPKLNSLVVIDYRVSNGPAGNGARSFSIDFDPTNPAGELISSPTLTLGDVANNGDDPEDNESIRYYAPRHFQVQERTVTASDYEVSLRTQFPEIDAVAVYGGEEITPPQYGRVFVAIDIADVDGLPDSKKDEYLSFLRRRAPFSIDPVIIEPEFLYLDVATLVRYNINITTKSINRIATIVTDAVTSFNTDFLNAFNTTMRYSKLCGAIDESDVSIVSNVTDVAMYKKLNPRLQVAQNITVDFGIPLVSTLADQTVQHAASDQKSVYSSLFKFGGVDCALEDDSNGVMRIVKQVGETDVTVKNVGTVNYDTGAINLVNFNIDNYSGSALKIYAVPRDRDITSSRNTIMLIEPDAIHVSPEVVHV